MKHKLIKTENYLLVVDDSKIRNADIIYVTPIDKHLADKNILSHLPLNGSPVLEGVDLLPELPTEVELVNLKQIRNYFGENDKTLFHHKAFAVLDKIIKSHKPKMPVGFESEIVYKEVYNKFGIPKSLYGIKTIINSFGQTVWIGEYIFND